MKKTLGFILSLLIVFSFISPAFAEESVKNVNTTEQISGTNLEDEIPTKKELIDNDVALNKVDSLIEKMENNEQLDADKYLEYEKNLVLATEEQPYFRKDFADGSFIENTIEDVTINESTPLLHSRAITQTGGTQEYRTLKITTTKAWGTMRFYVKIYFPLQGYAQILQAYDWYYLGSVYSTEYKGIYRAKETATADAVAIYKLQIETAGNTGIRYLAKTEFRIKKGKYWTVYSA